MYALAARYRQLYAVASCAGFGGSSYSASKSSNRLYALHQQVTIGPSNIPKPKGWSLTVQSKWTSCFARPLFFSRAYGSNSFGPDTLARAAAKIGQSVVSLSIHDSGLVQENIASGTIVHENGTILTTSQVLEDFDFDRGTKLVATLQNGCSFKCKLLVTYDHLGLSMLKINRETPLPKAKLGSSSQLRPGDWVLALGCPLELQNTITAGVVSHVKRTSSELSLDGPQRVYLQTDCTIQSGNFGGPLCNLDAEIIGVLQVKLEGEGFGFATPIDIAKSCIERHI